MNLSIKIEKLFGNFNYELSFDKQVSILTSPNGFGKKTILKMLHFLYVKNFNRLLEIDFSIFEVKYGDNLFHVSKNNDGLLITCNGTLVLDFKIQEFINHAAKLSYVKNNQTGKWTIEHYLHLDIQAPIIPEVQIINRIYFTNSELTSIWNKLPKTLLIRADRLIDYDDVSVQQIYHNQQNMQDINLTVNRYSHELRNLISNTFNNYFTESQRLDSTFMQAFMQEIINFNEDTLDEDNYKKLIQSIEEKNLLLLKYGISQAIQESTPQYDEKHKAVFTIYIKHRTKKLSKFDDLLTRCELFTKIINEKRLVNKNIVINMQNGITAQRSDGRNLALQLLSNGEQNQLILLYELLFRTQNINLVLIDEPEVGLHVSWQLEFLNDLKKILEISTMSSIIVTHSPQIINNEWEEVIDLSKQHENQQ